MQNLDCQFIVIQITFLLAETQQFYNVTRTFPLLELMAGLSPARIQPKQVCEISSVPFRVLAVVFCGRIDVGVLLTTESRLSPKIKSTKWEEKRQRSPVTPRHNDTGLGVSSVNGSYCTSSNSNGSWQSLAA